MHPGSCCAQHRVLCWPFAFHASTFGPLRAPQWPTPSHCHYDGTDEREEQTSSAGSAGCQLKHHAEAGAGGYYPRCVALHGCSGAQVQRCIAWVQPSSGPLPCLPPQQYMQLRRVQASFHQTISPLAIAHVGNFRRKRARLRAVHPWTQSNYDYQILESYQRVGCCKERQNISAQNAAEPGRSGLFGSTRIECSPRFMLWCTQGTTA